MLLLITQSNSPVITTRVGTVMMVNKLNCLRTRRRGKELKVPHYASAAAVRDGNLPYIIATCLYSQHWQLFFYGCPLYITDTIKYNIIKHTRNILYIFYLFPLA